MESEVRGAFRPEGIVLVTGKTVLFFEVLFAFEGGGLALNEGEFSFVDGMFEGEDLVQPANDASDWSALSRNQFLIVLRTYFFSISCASRS